MKKISCKINIEENEECVQCCKTCENKCRKCCIFDKRNMDCNYQIIEEM